MSFNAVVFGGKVHVHGYVVAPNPGVKVSLQVSSAQGSNPATLVLDLVKVQGEGGAIDVLVLAEVSGHFDNHAYTSVVVREGEQPGKEIPIASLSFSKPQ